MSTKRAAAACSPQEPFCLRLQEPVNAVSPAVVYVKATTVVSDCTWDVAAVLDEDESGLGIRTTDVEAIVWSHNHFDHTGDPSRFPSTTELVVGPGVAASSWPGHSSNPDGIVLDSEAAGRPVLEISFESPNNHKPLRVGRFNAVDYFGDRSFYLLNASTPEG
ncbi:hypothetical protein AbraIFM66951_006969 [Aspergillus brasiliensis]|uniref:Metallo-beta-lactamase domain-containing protein n=1 Tax=Aspergillus brasiliensis TaxID=319629 RepID=A0A9W6DUF9_9EURO|nr:hypothetical protein AbraCBS73388_006213 [Aspergillus brasiliensis]GKZ51746.1 hypothetical protein AbraIFM66951_006969 [Aspergillus brasiliensis]